MRFRLALLAIAAVLLAAVPASNEGLNYNMLVANQPGNFSWSGTPPTPSNEAVTYGRYKALVTNTTAAPCPAGLLDNLMITWNIAISCAVGHGAAQQSEAVNGSYQTVTYTARYNSRTGLYTCSGPNGSDGYSGTPITLPAGTVGPSSSTPLHLHISIAYSGSTSVTAELKNPSGTVVYTQSDLGTGSIDTGNYAVSGPSGAWSWVIVQSGGSDGTCDPTNGALGGGTQVTWSGTAYWWQ